MSEPADERPWELPGVVRRDCAPHRGRLLLWLAGTSMPLAALTFLLFLPGLLGTALAVAVWACADRDLAKMRAGRMDRAGRGDTEEARSLAIPALFISLLGLLLCAAPAWQLLH